LKAALSPVFCTPRVDIPVSLLEYIDVFEELESISDVSDKRASSSQWRLTRFVSELTTPDRLEHNSCLHETSLFIAAAPQAVVSIFELVEQREDS
jgi:hypothetical protein